MNYIRLIIVEVKIPSNSNSKEDILFLVCNPDSSHIYCSVSTLQDAKIQLDELLKQSSPTNHKKKKTEHIKAVYENSEVNLKLSTFQKILAKFRMPYTEEFLKMIKIKTESYIINKEITDIKTSTPRPRSI
ncbi:MULTISPECIES: hypothetical protein [Pantoea]|uniref:hypothetical protein n=1 Tax=Pantoea TaxID=53335 RepID=UPI001B311BAB|nr:MULTISPECIES: hypothetical protein [Pantoea]MDN4623691.1 hypothetical protein [Pantoea agglomerans]